MRIAINTRFLLPSKMEGFGWYTYEIVSRITKNNPECQFVLFFDRPVDSKFVFNSNVECVVLSPQARHPFLFVWWFEWSVRRALKKHNIDVFLSPDGYISLFSKVPQISVIHDISFEYYPKDIPWFSSKYLRTFFPLFAKKSRKIITVSNTTKEDLVKKYHVSAEKIRVIWNGVSESYMQLDLDTKNNFINKHTDGVPYFLFVGSIHPRKNVQRLIDSFSLFVKESDKDFKLIIIGESMWRGNVLDIPQNVKSLVVFTGHLSNEMLSKYMGSAYALSYVPYFEGFGLPIVEAMKCGVPIVCGNKTSLPEVAGNAAIYCNPFDIDEIKNQMLALANSEDLYKKLVANGLKRSKLFSWDNTAKFVWEEVVSCYMSRNGKDV